MPDSNCSGFSTASKQAIAALRVENAATIAAKDAEMEVERKKKEAELEAMRNQMAELAKSLNDIQHSNLTSTTVRGRGRGRGLSYNPRGGG